MTVDRRVEPAESPVLPGGQPGPRKIEGGGTGHTPPLWEPSLADEVPGVSTDDTEEVARRLARAEALFAGTSSGANVVAAIRVAERLGPGAKAVTLPADSLRPQVRERRPVQARVGGRQAERVEPVVQRRLSACVVKGLGNC